jgi:large subunit ribosomal protein L7/L12
MTKEEIIESISKMSVMELAELIKALEEKFNISASIPLGAPVAQPATGTGPAQAQEQTTFNVILSNPGDKKIQVIKIIREITGLGLKEAKDIVDSAPKPIKEGVGKEEAEAIKKKFEGTGAVIEIK